MTVVAPSGDARSRALIGLLVAGLVHASLLLDALHQAPPHDVLVLVELRLLPRPTVAEPTRAVGPHPTSKPRPAPAFPIAAPETLPPSAAAAPPIAPLSAVVTVMAEIAGAGLAWACTMRSALQTSLQQGPSQ